MKRLVAVLCLILGACAARDFNGRFQPVGELRDTSGIEKAAKRMKWDDARDVKVLLGECPEGIECQGASVVSTKAGPYELLGSVSADVDGGLFARYPEDEGWKNGYCMPQRILLFPTGFVWALVPTFYPCFQRQSDSPGERRESAILPLDCREGFGTTEDVRRDF